MQKITVRQMTLPDEKESIAARILQSLPEWFGIPESTAQYIRDSRSLPFFASFDGQGEPDGFIVPKETGPRTCEICVMGVRPDCHRRGIGTALWEAFRRYAVGEGYLYVQVKTVQMGRYACYDQTNRFYQKCGFSELEVFPTLWDEHNPCQIYIQYIGS